MKIIVVSPKKRYYCYDLIIGRGAFKIVYKAYDVERGIFVAWNSIELKDLHPWRFKMRQNNKII